MKPIRVSVELFSPVPSDPLKLSDDQAQLLSSALQAACERLAEDVLFDRILLEAQRALLGDGSERFLSVHVEVTVDSLPTPKPKEHP